MSSAVGSRFAWRRESEILGYAEILNPLLTDPGSTQASGADGPVRKIVTVYDVRGEGERRRNHVVLDTLVSGTRRECNSVSQWTSQGAG